MASEQATKQKVEQFFHHGKTEHPPTDVEVGKKPAGESNSEHEEKINPLLQPVERRVHDAVKQADQYGREMNIAQTRPQTLIDEQDPFGARESHENSESREPREKISLYQPAAVDGSTDIDLGNLPKQ